VLVVPVVRVVVWIGGRVLVTCVLVCVVVVCGGGGGALVVVSGAEVVTGGAFVVTGAAVVVVTVCEVVVDVFFVTLRLCVALCVALLCVLDVSVAEASGAYVVPVLEPPELPQAATATASATPPTAAVIVTNARFIRPAPPW
jgi:hypothetical protein